MFHLIVVVILVRMNDALEGKLLIALSDGSTEKGWGAV